jgi:hypothetical protein
LRQSPYVERKRQLQQLLSGAQGTLSYVEYLEGEAPASSNRAQDTAKQS